MAFNGYSFENEINNNKSRCGIYVSNKISYVRRSDIEIENLHVMIIDLNDKYKTRIINIYRPFNPPNTTQRQIFENQIRLRNKALSDFIRS